MSNTNVSAGLATICAHRPWPWAIGWALIPVLFTSIGFGYAQSQQFDDRRTYLATAAAVTAAAEAEAIALNQYRAGTVSYLNVVTAQATHLAARRNANDLAARRLLAAVQLAKNAGGGVGE